MIIERLDLIAFGLFTDASIDLSQGPRRFHLVYGPNESGKSTSLRAISSLLFGMPHVSEDNYLHPNTRLRVGGTLTDNEGNRLVCVRRRGRRATLRDASDSDPVDEAMLEQMLGGVDRDSFLSQYGLSHEELTTGGEAILRGDGDLGEILFAAGAGVGRLHEIQCELDEASGERFAPRGNRSINVAVRELDKQRKRLREAQLPPAEFNSLKKRIEDKRKQSLELDQSLHQIAAELSRLKAYKRATSLLPRWRHDTESLAEIGQIPILDEAFTERRRKLESEQQAAMHQLRDLEQRLESCRSRLESLPEDSSVAAHAAEIEHLFQEVAARNKADRDRRELRRIQQKTDRQITELLRDLSIEMLTDDETEQEDLIEDSVQRLRISDSLRSRIHELAAKHERVIQQRDDARDDLAIIRKRLGDLDRELQSLGEPADPATLINAIDRVGAPAAILESETQQAEDCDHLRRECEASLARLVGFDGSYQQAVRLTPPAPAEVQRSAESIRLSEQRLEGIREKMQTLQQQRKQAERDFDRQQHAEPLPTADRLIEVRADRDRLVEDLLEQAASAVVTVDDLRNLGHRIDMADQVVDTLRSRQQEIHQRASQQERIHSLGQEIDALGRDAERCVEDLTSAREQWQTLWQACGVVAASPERMTTWLTQHQQLVQSVERYQEQQARLEKMQQQIERSANLLRSAIRTAATTMVRAGTGMTADAESTDQESPHDLIALYDEAVSTRGQLTRNRQQYDTIRRRHTELADELPAAETRLASHEKNVRQWQEDWHRVTESFTDSGQASPTVVMSMVRRIDELCSKKRERDILATRIRSIGDDEEAFASRVRSVADAVGATAAEGITVAVDGASDDPIDAGRTVSQLYQRLQADRTGARERATLREQIEEASRRKRELQRQRDACQTSIVQLCSEAKCDQVSDLPEIERQSRHRQQLEKSLRDLRDQLTMLAGEQPLETFVDQAGQQDPTMVDVQIQRHEEELSRLRESISTVDQELGGLRHQLAAMDGGAAASEIAQSIQLSAAGIVQDAEEYAKLRVASLLLRRAIDHYRRENQSPVLGIAERIFADLTCGEYPSLKVDFDTKGKSILFGVRRDRSGDGGTTDVPAPAMSSGTADALYLALRLASIRHQLHHGPVIPLVIDDCLIQLDDERSVAALKAFSDLSQHTQVVLFTHHQHLLDLAEANLEIGHYHVQRLDAGVT